ncbi:hypothetical protein ACPPVO_02955 [Dactylosporangium sp. McL0621]|uniref:hypothetical protein n=1 Tax=Dactylosporangium sp. McL0621 TaxID=3415678 RepID=UPI003CE781FF
MRAGPPAGVEGPATSAPPSTAGNPAAGCVPTLLDTPGAANGVAVAIDPGGTTVGGTLAVAGAVIDGEQTRPAVWHCA